MSEICCACTHKKKNNKTTEVQVNALNFRRTFRFAVYGLYHFTYFIHREDCFVDESEMFFIVFSIT